MSSAASEQHRAKQLRLASIVEYSAVGTPPLRQTQRPRRSTNVAPALESIPTGSAVICRDGKAGYVAGVVACPPYGCSPQILVRHGWLRPRTFRVFFEQITQASPASITLALGRHELLRQPEYRHDYLIEEAIEALFHGAGALDTHSDFVAVRATAQDGVVSLCGNVRDAERRSNAERTVARIPGVLLVRNYLAWDDDITWQAAHKLKRDARLQLADVRIETCLGLVRLFGRVATPRQRSLATAVAGQIPGVHAVGNSLAVDPALRCGSVLSTNLCL